MISYDLSGFLEWSVLFSRITDRNLMAGVGYEAVVKPEIVHAKNEKKCMQKFEVEVI